MPVPGTKPKPEGQKRHRIKSPVDWVEIPNVPYEGGPKLPVKWTEGRPWPTRTKRWWTAISSMPHCTLWGSTDWEYALDTAYVHAQFAAGDMRQAAELRNREKLLGNTFDSRRDLRIRYVEAAEGREEVADVTN